MWTRGLAFDVRLRTRHMLTGFCVVASRCVQSSATTCSTNVADGERSAWGAIDYVDAEEAAARTLLPTFQWVPARRRYDARVANRMPYGSIYWRSGYVQRWHVETTGEAQSRESEAVFESEHGSSQRRPHGTNGVTTLSFI